MPETIAIMGAGPGMGLSVARRFGREGFRVALVARNADRLDSFVAELGDAGIEAAAFPADLSDRGAHGAVLAAINDRFGTIDAAVLSGFIDPALIRPTRDVDIDNMRAVLDGILLASLSLTRLLVPGMVERGRGTVLYGLGISAKESVPVLGSYGPAGAGLRIYAHNLHEELADRGVYVGMMTIGVLIERSDAQRLYDASPEAARGLQPERMDPDVLAELAWEMHRKRDRAEETVGTLV